MIGTIIIFLLIFFVIVMGHEFGHFLIAKVNGIRVNEFAIGMGPKIAGFKKGETEYVLRAFPLGGACIFEGEDGLETAKEETSAAGTPADKTGRGALPQKTSIGRFFALLRNRYVRSDHDGTRLHAGPPP